MINIAIIEIYYLYFFNHKEEYYFILNEGGGGVVSNLSTYALPIFRSTSYFGI